MSRKPAIGFIFVTLLLDITGLGIIIPVLPTLIIELIGGTNSEASFYGMLMMFSYASMQFIFSPIIGGLSDQFGRRPVLLFSLFGFGVDYLFMAWAPTLGWLFLGRIISGIMGSNIATASAYIADISTPKTRAQNFGIIGAAFGLGFIIGPLLGGVLGAYGTRIPFLVSAGLVFLNWLYGFFILPESHAAKNRRPFQWKRANPTATLRNLKKYPVILGMVASLVLLYISSHAVQSNWVYFTQEKFDWDIKLVGYSLAFVGFIFVIIQGGLIRVIIPALGQERSVYVGLFLSSSGYVLYALATNTIMMFGFTIVYCLGSIAGPALQGIISTQVPPDEQGELQGGLSSLQAMTSIVGPIVMMGLFRIFTAESNPIYFPEISMILGAILTLTGAILARRSLKRNMAIPGS